jgi:ribosomal protein L11 methylase PrmA
VDNNSLARQVAAANVRANNVASQVEIAAIDLRAACPPLAFDVVIANLYHKLLLALFERPEFWRGKTYILSGFISPMEAELLAALPPGIKFLRRESTSRWCMWMLETGN